MQFLIWTKINMTTFTFSTVSDIQVGVGSAARLSDMCQKHNITNPLIVTDAGILKFGLLDKALSGLIDNNINHTMYSDVQADPADNLILEATNVCIQKNCDAVIGFGGGSSMDVAKVVAVLAKQEQNLEDIYGVDNISSSRLPLIQIPTTAGTGSEATMVAVITTGATTKAGVVSRSLLADAIILDAELTVGLPPHITAATGIDAMVHAIEAYTSVRLKNPMSDGIAKQALFLLAGAIKEAVHNGKNIKAREDMLLGAMYAGQAFANAPVAAVHALAYPLGGQYHIPHGLSNSLVLPHVLRFNATEADELYAELLECFALSSDGLSPASLLADYFLDLAKNLGIPTNLREMDIPESDLKMLATEGMKQQRLLINNPREVTYEDALAIYRAAF